MSETDTNPRPSRELREDARLIVEFNRWAVEWGFHDANKWFWSQDYDPDPVRFMALPISDPEVQDFYAVCGYYETFGLFYAKAIVDRDLVLEWLDFVGPWERACAIALAQREAQRFDGLWEHFEGLAMAQRLWFESRAVAAGP